MLAALAVAAALLGAGRLVTAQRDIVIDDSNTTAIFYEPRAAWNHWTAGSDTFNPGINSNDTLSVPLQTVTNASVTFNFTGIGFAYYGTTHPDTKSCNLTLDGQFHQLNIQSPDKATHYGQLIFSLQGLPEGSHSVVIQQDRGVKSSLFEIDRFVYTVKGSQATVDSVPTSLSQGAHAPTSTADASPPSGSSGPNPGVIAGGVVSGVVVFAAALGIFWWLRRLDALDPKPKNSRPTSGDLTTLPNHSNPSGFNSSRPVSYNPATTLSQGRSVSSSSKGNGSSRLNSPAPFSAANGPRPGLLPPLKSLSELNGQRDSPTPGPSSPRRIGRSSPGGSNGRSHNRTSTERSGSSNGGPSSFTDQPGSSLGSQSRSNTEPVAGPSKTAPTPQPIIIPAAMVNRDSTTSETFEYPYEYAQYLLATPRTHAYRISAESGASGRPLLPPASPTSISSSSRIASPPPGRVVSPPPQRQVSSSTNANPNPVSPLPSSRNVRIASPLPLRSNYNARVASPPLRNGTSSPQLTKRSGTPPIRTVTAISPPATQSTPMTSGITAAAPPLLSRPRSNSLTPRLNIADPSGRVNRSNSLSGTGALAHSSPSPQPDPNVPLSHSKGQHPFAYPNRSGSSPPSPARENFAKQYGW